MRTAPIAALMTNPLRKVSPTYVQVNIGRNIDDVPLGARQWAAFVSEVEGLVRNTTIGRGIVSTHTGRGAWLDDNGVTVSEESAYISTFAAVDVPALRAALANTARRFEQDAIALIVGSELIRTR